MFNLYHIAKNSLKSGEVALSIAENNISNANNIQYHREKVIIGANSGKNIPEGYIGNGACINDIFRINDEISNEKIRYSNGVLHAIYAKNNKLQHLDNFFSNNIENFSKQLNDVFDALESIAQQPSNGIYRTNITLELESLVHQFNKIGKEIKNIELNATKDISFSIETINNLSKELANINCLISQSINKKIPLNLLDKRDALLEELSKKIGILTNINEEEIVYIKLENGSTLLDNNETYPLIYEKNNIQNITISSTNNNQTQEKKIKINSNNILKGELGGLISFYNQNIPKLKEKINQAILKFVQLFNTVNHQGYDFYHKPGGDIFSYKLFNHTGSNSNSGNAKISNIETNDSNNIFPSTYNLLYESDQWKIVKTFNGKKETIECQIKQENLKSVISFDNLSLNLDGLPKNGDKFKLNVAMDIAESIKLNLSDGNKIASSNDKNTYNNNFNILELIDIQNKKIFDNKTFSENYADFISYIGQTTKNIQNIQDSQEKINKQLHLEYENKIGINLNEEYVYIELYRQYYYANIQLIKIASSLFESLLGIVKK
ncbi:MAG: flagellar hook-associated protein FlgK [Wigglesworthia glossinidia]|nr:flagellar hook-associated protein FlgK [Wigglesworthia glossinidia]